LGSPYSGDGSEGSTSSPYSTSNRRYGVSAPITPPGGVDPERGTSYQYNNWNTGDSGP
jgi:hypothetical protein